MARFCIFISFSENTIDNAYQCLWGYSVNLWEHSRNIAALEDSSVINLVEVLNSLQAWAKIFFKINQKKILKDLDMELGLSNDLLYPRLN